MFWIISSRVEKKRAGSLWFDEDANFLMDANVSKLDIPEPYFMFMNHEDISDVFVSAANKNESFSFIAVAYYFMCSY